MHRIKEVLQEKGIKQTWLAGQLGKSYNMLMAMCKIDSNRDWKYFMKSPGS